jgi:precorrin-6Y C5,15-methyltransferase (decarboxylating)
LAFFSDGRTVEKSFGTITLLGLDDPLNLPPKTQTLIKEAKIIAGPERWLSALNEFNFKGQKIPLKSNLVAWLSELEKVSQTLNTVVLASGDPNFFGLARKLLSIIPPERVNIIPATTTVQKAFARLKTTWAGVEVHSLHGRSSWPQFWSALYRASIATGTGRLAIFTDEKNGPNAIARALLDKGLNNFKILVFEELDTPNEKITSLELEKACLHKFSTLNLTVLEQTKPPKPITLGAPEQNYLHEAGLITKSEIRSVALGLLELSGSDIFWDIGTCSGAVSIEAALFLTHGAIYSIEKNPYRAAQASFNRSLYGVAHMEVLTGEALSLIPTLPSPDRVFIGGGGADLEKIINGVRQKLKPNGIIVAATITQDSFETATRCLSLNDKLASVTQLSVARSQTLLKSFYLKPINQIWLVKGRF